MNIRIFFISVLGLLGGSAAFATPDARRVSVAPPEPASASAVRVSLIDRSLRAAYVLRPSRWAGDRAAFVDLVRSTGRDLWVVDPSFDVERPSRWTAADLETMRSTDPDRKILARVDLSVVQPGREYWSDTYARRGVRTPEAPSWLGAPSSDEPGAWTVQYWDPRWREVMREELDGLIARGFDGVVFAGVDAWRGAQAAQGAKNPATGRAWGAEVVEVVDELADYARSGALDGFVVMTEGGVELLDQPSHRSRLDGLVAADLYGGGAERASWLERYLTPFAAEGGAVLVVEDQLDPDARTEAERDALGRGWSLLFLGDDRANLGLAVVAD